MEGRKKEGRKEKGRKEGIVKGKKGFIILSKYSYP
jgi:hypothetical protein